jgi:biotin carboxylase
METIQRFVRSAARLPDVRLGLITTARLDAVPADIRDAIAAHWRAPDMMEAPGLLAAARGLMEQMGGADRLIGVLEQIQTPLAIVRRELGLPGLSPEVAENFRDKARMKTVLRNAGLPVAHHGLAAGIDDAVAIARRIGFPLVIKPPAGAGAVATYRVNHAGELAEALGILRPSPSKPALLEEFVVGKEHSFDCVLRDGEPLFHSVSRYYPAPLEVLENPWIQWCVLLPRDISGQRFAAIRDVGVRAVRALGLSTGLAHLEWFERPDGTVAISEVGARPPGAQFVRLISYAHDIDFYAAWARLMIRDEFEPPERKYAVGAAYLRGQGRGRIRAIHGLDEAQREVGGLVVESRLPQEGRPVSGTYEGEGYVIVRHPDTEVVRQALSRIVSLVRVETGGEE